MACRLVPHDKKDCCVKDPDNEQANHLLPDAMFRDPKSKINFIFFFKEETGKDAPRYKLPTAKGWDHYKGEKAPTMCVEGWDGDHKEWHIYLSFLLGQMSRVKIKPTYKSITKSVSTQAAVNYGCNDKCIQAQLDAYYLDQASNTGRLGESAEVVPHSGLSMD